MELNELVARVNFCGSVRVVSRLGFSPLDYENRLFSIRHIALHEIRILRMEDNTCTVYIYRMRSCTVPVQSNIGLIYEVKARCELFTANKPTTVYLVITR